MVNDPLTQVGTRQTRQTHPADPRQEVNSAGGFTFVVDELTRLRRFLVTGVQAGTYYVKPPELTRDNADALLDLIRTRPTDVVDEIVRISEAGRAHRHQPGLFTLAACAGVADDAGRAYALAALPRVARTGTHLFIFIGYVRQFRGWGRALRRAVASWYLTRSVDDLAYQCVKYRRREDWSHRDVVRLAHPVTLEPARRALLNWVSTGDVVTSRAPGGAERPVGATRADLPAIVDAFGRAQATTRVDEWVTLIREYPLSWEMLPDRAVTEPRVWEALLERGLPQTALLRQLPRLTRLGLLGATGPWAARVAAQLSDVERLRRGRVHPLAVLLAHRTYVAGHGDRGSSTWQPTRPVVDALDAAFYAAFQAVEPTGRRHLLALDVSGSMGWNHVANTSLTAREGSAALALVTAATESRYELLGFGNTLVPLSISPRQRLADAVRAVSNLPFGGTDCSLPMLHALEHGLEVDCFTIYTDNETWAGRVHPHEALRRYRAASNINAKLVVVGMTATRFTIADPSDPGMLDVAGFDASLPTLLADFARE